MRRFAVIVPLVAAAALCAAVIACDGGDGRGPGDTSPSVTPSPLTTAQRLATSEALAALTGIAEAHRRATEDPFNIEDATARSAALTAIPEKTAAALAALDLRPRWVPVTSSNEHTTNPPLDAPYLIDPHAGDVWTLDVPGLSERPLQVFPARPLAWSPRGDLLIGVSFGTRHELYLSRPPEEPRLATTRANGVYRAAWSPDGELVALDSPGGIEVLRAADWSVEFSHDDLFVAPTGWSADGAYLVVHPGDGVIKARIYDRAQRSVTHEFDASSMEWESAGTRIAYVPGTGVASDAGEIAVRLLDAQSGADQILTYVQARHARVSSWSPDDRYIAVDLFGPGGQRTELVDLRDPGRRVAVTFATSHGWIDGSTALVVGDYCDTWTVMAISARDGSVRRYAPTEGPDFEFDPHLSPDRRFAALWTANGPALLDIAGARMQDLAGVPREVMFSRESAGAWSPDSRFALGRVPGGRDGPCLQEAGGQSVIKAIQ